jgi:hypothetical protein
VEVQGEDEGRSVGRERAGNVIWAFASSGPVIASRGGGRSCYVFGARASGVEGAAGGDDARHEDVRGHSHAAIGWYDWKVRLEDGLEDATGDKCNMKGMSREDALAYERKRCRKRCTTCARRIRIWCID